LPRQTGDSPTRGDAIMDLLLTNISEFTVLRDMGQAKSKIRMLNFKKANFQLFRELVNKAPWESVFKDKRVE